MRTLQALSDRNHSGHKGYKRWDKACESRTAKLHCSFDPQDRPGRLCRPQLFAKTSVLASALTDYLLMM